MKRKKVLLLGKVQKCVDAIITTKVSLVVIFVLFGAVLAVGVAIASRVGGFNKPCYLRSSAAELSNKVQAYGYQNPRVVSEQGTVSVQPGSTEVPAFIFRVYAPSNRSITTNNYQINFFGDTKLITNLSLVKDGVVLGKTVHGNSSGAVTFSSLITIPAGGSSVFQIVTDVSSNVPKNPVYGYPAPSNFAVGVQSIQYIDQRPSVIEGLPLANTVYVGSGMPVPLHAALSASTPIARTVVSGSKDVSITTIRFLSNTNSVALDGLSIGVTPGASRASVSNIRLFDGSTLLGSIPELSEPYGDIFLGVIPFRSSLLIPAYSIKEIRIVADVTTRQDVTALKLGLVGLSATPPVFFTGALPLYGHEVSIINKKAASYSVEGAVDLSATKIRAAWTAPAGSSAKDWIGLYKQGETDDKKYIAWQYTKGDAIPTFGMIFANPGVGTYELRYFLDNGYTKVATSSLVVVTDKK